MVLLEHQRFWEPSKGPSRVCSDNGPGDDTLEYKDNPSLMWKNVRQMVICYGNTDHLMGMKRRTLVCMVIYESYFLLGWSNRITTVLQNEQSKQDTLPEAPVSNILAADNYLDHPDYPEEVSLSPYSSASSSSPSVTGLDGPGTSRIFDVFQDDPRTQAHACTI